MNKINIKDLFRVNRNILKEEETTEAIEQMWPGVDYDFEEISSTLKSERILVEHEIFVANACDIALWMISKKHKHANKVGIELLHWLVKIGSSAAKYNLAIEYFRKNPQVNINAEEACGLIKDVIKNENKNKELLSLANKIYADCLFKGNGVKQNIDMSFFYFQASAELGDIEAAFSTGLFYHGKIEGKEKRFDLDMAAKYYERAMKGGHLHAQTNFGLLNATEAIKGGNKELGFRLLRKSAFDGDTVAAQIIQQLQEIYEIEEEWNENDVILESSIKKGDFNEGEQLPYDHPDFTRITEALFSGQKEINSLEDINIQEALANAGDHVLCNYIMNHLSINRAAGNIPDIVFDDLIKLVSTKDGRMQFSKMVAGMMDE